MKKVITKKSVSVRKNLQQASAPKHHIWVLLLLALLSGFVIGYTTHFSIVNWHGFFATCPDGNRPDKNGCCAGEVYTDAGDGWMVCCPDGNDNCFPPIK